MSNTDKLTEAQYLMTNRNKIVLGTCFSGIGAIEHAINRLGIDHEIAFACDNGGRIIECDYETELQNIRKLKNEIEKKKYVDDLYKTNSKQKKKQRPKRKRHKQKVTHKQQQPHLYRES